MKPILAATASLLLLAACGEDAADSDIAETETTQAMDMPDGMDHGAMTAAETGIVRGRVVAAEGPSRIRIAHDAIPAAGMDAMTMSFEAMRGVALDGLEQGDEVHFRLERGRDGTYRISALCGLEAADHEACMAAMANDR